MDGSFAPLGLALSCVGLVGIGLAVALLVLRRWHRTVLRRMAELSSGLHDRLDAIDQGLGVTRDELRDSSKVVRKSITDATDQVTDKLTEHAIDQTKLDKAVRSGAADAARRTRNGVSDDLMRMFRQLEALQNLHAIVDIDQPLPSSRVWAASPDLLLYMVDLVGRRRPELIVECGSGLSTLWYAFALRRNGIPGGVVSLEHLESYAEQTRELVARHGVADLVDVRWTPLESYRLDGETYSWYERKGWSDLSDIDLLFVDGPPADTNPHARYPALPLLLDRLSPNGAVLLDDLVREDERETLESWQSTYPELVADRIRLEKHAALVHRGPAADAVPGLDE